MKLQVKTFAEYRTLHRDDLLDPSELDEFAGQSHILGPGQLLRRAIEADRI